MPSTGWPSRRPTRNVFLPALNLTGGSGVSGVDRSAVRDRGPVVPPRVRDEDTEADRHRGDGAGAHVGELGVAAKRIAADERDVRAADLQGEQAGDVVVADGVDAERGAAVARADELDARIDLALARLADTRVLGRDLDVEVAVPAQQSEQRAGARGSRRPPAGEVARVSADHRRGDEARAAVAASTAANSSTSLPRSAESGQLIGPRRTG
jgi:hypothetical protein